MAADVAGPASPVPGPDDVVGPPLVPYFVQADIDAAYALGRQHAKADFDREPLWRIAWDRFDRWLRRL